MKKKLKVIALVGPSASGKTSISIELAKRLDGEIISADSRLIYKEFDIATAKPLEVERQGIKHHFIDIIEPTEDYSVADFSDNAKHVIEKIVDQGKVPIITGGTGLYFKVLLENVDLPRVAPNFDFRKQLEEKTSEELYSMLLESDEKLAEKIHKNNRVKIIRALEVIEVLKIPMSEAQKKKEAQYDALWIGLTAKKRSYIYERINQRVDKMLEQGLLDEAKKLFEKYPNLNLLISTIGYKEFKDYFIGDISLNEAIENIKQNTRRYAKRQLSWFRSNQNINWFNIDEQSHEQILKEIEAKWTNSPAFQSC